MNAGKKENLKLEDIPKLSDSQINKSVVCFTKELNLIAGSFAGYNNVSYDLYKLMQVYLRDNDRRKLINEILQ